MSVGDQRKNPNHRPIHVRERNVNYHLPNTFSKSRRVINITNVEPIKNNKIQNQLTPSIYVSTAQLGVVSIDITTQVKATSFPVRILHQYSN